MSFCLFLKGMHMHRKAAEDRLANSSTGQSFLARQRQASNRRSQAIISGHTSNTTRWNGHNPPPSPPQPKLSCHCQAKVSPPSMKILTGNWCYHIDSLGMFIKTSAKIKFVCFRRRTFRELNSEFGSAWLWSACLKRVLPMPLQMRSWCRALKTIGHWWRPPPPPAHH